MGADDRNDRSDDARHSEPLPAGREAAAGEGPAVGRDEWVARHGERCERRAGRLGVVEERLQLVPWWAWLILFLAACALLPAFTEDGYVRRVAFDTVVYMLLALGLNVVVGWGGLLDLGYIAFYGIGAYAYALLSSEQFGVHWPTVVTVPLIVLIGAVAGLLVGLPSRRLVGDYLAIVTLFFFQFFQVAVTNGDDVRGENITGGSNGISDIDAWSFFGADIPPREEGVFNVAYLYVGLAVFAVVLVALRFVNTSRTGRAWRSLREDPLAAEVMGMPVNWLKLMAFSFGAAAAALTGSLSAAVVSGVFPQTFAFPLLIIVYTMVILGGSGSQAGVVLGAIIVSVLLEVLREPADSRYVFYAFLLLGLVAVFRLTRQLAVVLAGTFLLGLALRLLAAAYDESWTGKAVEESGRLADLVARWVIVPGDPAEWVGPVSYISLVALVLLLTLLHGWWRVGVLVPTLYLAAFVWENVMSTAPESMRYIVLGATLVSVMIVRPAGILGERRVEIV